MKLLSVEGCELFIEGGSASVTEATSVTNDHVTVDNKKAYHSIAFTATVGDYSGSGVINGSTTYSTDNGQAFVVQGDNVTIELTAAHRQPITGNVKVASAGQQSTSIE